MKLLKDHVLAGLIVFYLLSAAYALLLFKSIRFEHINAYDLLNLMFLNTAVFSDYNLSSIEPVLILLYALWLIVYLYDLNKKVFDDKSFYGMVIYRYASVKNALIALLHQLFQISLKFFVVNASICFMIIFLLPSKSIDYIKIVFFLIKISVIVSSLSISIQKNAIFKDERSHNYSIYIFMLIFLFCDITVNTHFITYSNNLLKDLIYFIFGIMMIWIQLGCCFYENRKGKLYD